MRFRAGTVSHSFCKHPLPAYVIGKLEQLRFSFDEVEEFAQSWRSSHSDLLLSLLYFGITGDEKDNYMPSGIAFTDSDVEEGKFV